MRPGNENFACQEVDTFTSWNIPRKFKKFHWYVQIFDKYLKKRHIVCFASEIWDIFRRSPAGSSSSLSRNTVTPASEGDSTTSSWSSEKDTSLFDAP